MVFSSLLFLCIFLPVTMILYHLCSSIKIKNIVLLIASLVFYGWGEPKYILVMLLTVFVNYLAGISIEKNRKSNKAKLMLVISVIVTLGFLVVFKYLNFFTSNLSSILSMEIRQTNLTLPIGISFYTFQVLSYTVDVYRGHTQAQKSYYKLLLYVSMFPQLIAGPIVRYVDINKEISDRKVLFEDFSAGITRFVIGLAKKAILANLVGELAAGYLEGEISELTVLGSWLGIIAYFFQIYFDFSGYSDMAIGMGEMLGFKFHENFNYPYTAVSITDFWRRWHISLSSFFRDYVYIPLGGNKKHQMFNMLVVWSLTGFWHGASWNFIFWGLYYFVVLCLEKFVYGKLLKKIPAIFARVYTLFIVIIGWVFFYFEDTGKIADMLRSLFGFGNAGLFTEMDTILLKNNILLLLLAAVAVTPVARLINKRLSKLNDIRSGAVMYQTVVLLFQMTVLFICIASLVGSSYNPFLYFRF